MNGREWSLSTSKDNKYSKKSENVEKRKARDEKIEAQNSSELGKQTLDEDFQVSSEDSDVENSIRDPEYTFKSKKKQKTCNLVNVKLPSNILKNENLVGSLDRAGLSYRKSTNVIMSVLKSGDADLNDFKISTMSSNRKRHMVRKQATENIKRDFKCPAYCTLHWDGKILENVKGENKERLAVVISGSPEYEEGKILGTHFICGGSGEHQKNECMRLLTEWGADKCICALCFDTTASNTGVHKGAAIKIEQALEKKILYLACRHHMYELVLKSVYEHLFNYDPSDEITMFRKLRKRWDKFKTASSDDIDPLTIN